MIRLAFYAPMKPPTHPVPSGDREVARAVMQALGGAECEVALASDLRVHDAKGSVDAQDTAFAAASAEVARLVPLGRDAGWDAWVTYHCYYKAPDLIGPAVSDALGIPYLLIEATRARKRLSGPWARFAQASEAACDAAKSILYLTQRDAEALSAYAPPGQRLRHLAPFLADDALPQASSLDGPMLSVGMMRLGDKLASYDLIAQTLALLITPDWRLDIAGDGPARSQVERLMRPFGDKVRFLGQLAPAALRAQYAQASMLLWPGVNEAFGMSYLEAQAHGLPVIAQDRPGVRDVLALGDYPDVQFGASALAVRVDQLLSDGRMARARGAAARDHIAAQHLIGSARRTLRKSLSEVMT